MNSKNLNKYHESIAWLENLDSLINQSKRSKYSSCQRMKYFLKILNKIDDSFKFIHIAGTSGKGSVASMIHNIIKTADYKSGILTSPHLCATTERIKINDSLISINDFTKYLENLKPFILQMYKSKYGIPLYGEILLALALLYFKSKKVTYVVLETGIGGLKDYTNAITPIVTVITSINYDHTKLLGNTLEKIAFQKAGIIKKNIPLFINELPASAEKVIKKQCLKMSSACYKANSKYTLNKKKKNNIISFNYKSHKKISLKIIGEHQIKNATLAISVCEYLNINKKAIKGGLKEIILPGRLEIIDKKPILILDSAHNQEKINSTIKTINKNFIKNKKVLIFTIKENKDIKAIIKNIKQLKNLTHIYLTKPSSSYFQTFDLLKLKKMFSFKKVIVSIDIDAKNCIKKVIKEHNDKIILVTGSFYLSGEIRTCWHNKEKVLKNRSLF